MMKIKTRTFWTTPAILILFCVFELSSCPAAFGQAAPPGALSESDFIALVQSRQKQLEESSDLDDAAKNQIKELYQQVLAEIGAARKWAEQAAEFDRQAREAPKKIAELTAALALPPSAPATPIPPTDAKRLETLIAERQAELEQWRKELAADENELKQRALRRAKIPEQINAAKQRLAELTAQLQTPLAGEDVLPASAARRMILLAQSRTAEQEIKCCENELKAFEARTELLPKRRDYNVRRIAQATQDIKQWQVTVNQRRQEEAEQQAARAQREAAQAHPNVRELLEYNTQLAKMRKDFAERIVQATAKLDEVNRARKELAERFDPLWEQVKVAEKTGTTSLMGLALRKERDRLPLPGLRDYRRSAAEHQRIMGEGELDRLDVLNKRRALANLDLQTEAILEKLEETGLVLDRSWMQATVRGILQTTCDYLDALSRDHDAYFKVLADLTLAENQYVLEVEKHARDIDGRVLWISSAAPLGWSNLAADAASVRDALAWLVGPKAWLAVGRAAVSDVRRNPEILAPAAVFFALLFYQRRRFRARIREIGEKASRGGCCHFWPTMETAVLTVLIALAWPGLMYFVGWRLTAEGSEADVYWVLGRGLLETAYVFFALELLWNVCARGGLAEAHFAWSPGAPRVLRHTARWFSLSAIPFMCAVVAVAWQQENEKMWDAGLGRIAYIAAMLCFAWAMHRALRPSGVVFQAMIAARRGGWLERLRYIWHPLCLATPIALAVLSAAGYQYTARQLTTRLILTSYVVVGGVVCRSLLLRWALVNQRKLAIEQARQRRAAAASQSEGNAGDETQVAADMLAAAGPERDLAVINAQTRKLVEYALVVACSVAVWFAWTDVLPALGNLDVKIGTTLVTINREITSTDGKVIDIKPFDQVREVMLSNLCLALIILATTIIAAKNIPGLLELAVLQHLPFAAGSRYAVVTVCRYLISIAGLLACCAELGVGWSKVQWLVAAMSLGLGFGLQEIFANFISGLIILFERPVRVGDIVTIDATSGVVSRIRMRATTITDWDRKELIIPNKEFITGRVLNWTLSDPINRIVVNVGVAYGSDTQKTTEILRRIAQNHPNVLADPPPWVMLESFGDSALNFVLRCFLPNLENRSAVIHELHVAIERELRAAGIEIAFPQQDVHIRSVSLPAAVMQPPPIASGASRPPGLRPNAADRAA